MVDKNSYYEVEFTDLTHDAMGVCKIDDYPVFVKDGLKGEKALIKVIKMNKHFGFGRLIQLRNESPFRMRPICEHYQLCGGCNTMHMNYQMQLDFKRHRTIETLRKLGKIECPVHHTVAMNNPYYYRNKVIMPFGMRHGKVIAGLYQQRSHEIVNIKRCHVIPKILSDITRHLKAMIQELEIPIYDEQTDEGLIKAVMYRCSYEYNQISVTLITKNAKLPHKEIIVDKLIEKFPIIVSFVQNINEAQTNVLLGPKSRVLFGKDMIEDELLGLKYEISHRSFYQINPVQTALLYEKAMQYAKLKKTDVVIDAYCGIGTIGLTAAPRVKEVIGIDSVKDAIRNAGQNAKNNQLKNIRFILDNAEDVLPELRNKAIDVLFVDPPRKGCEKRFLETLVEMKIPRVIYISCNVSTLARDLNYLQANNYQVKEVTPFDMFPQTSHVECVVSIVYEKR